MRFHRFGYRIVSTQSVTDIQSHRTNLDMQLLFSTETTLDICYRYNP